MKVNLILKDFGGARSGFTNFSPFSPPDHPLLSPGDVFDLSHTIDPGELNELLALDILDYVPTPLVDKTINHWVGCLAHGGTITLGVTDARMTFRAFLDGSLSVAEANSLLHGNQRENWEFKKSLFTMPLLEEMLRSRGLEVKMKKIEGYRAVLSCRRP